MCVSACFIFIAFAGILGFIAVDLYIKKSIFKNILQIIFILGIIFCLYNSLIYK